MRRDVETDEKAVSVSAADFQVYEQIISALVVANIVTVNTLHARGVVDRRHFAHAFARSIDKLGDDPQNALLTNILQIVKTACIEGGASGQADVSAWLRQMVDSVSPAGSQTER